MWRLFKAESSTLISVLLLAIFTVICDFLSPLLFKIIIDIIEDPASHSGGASRSFLYAFMALVAGILRTISEAQMMWLCNKCAARSRGLLMACVTDKALRRKEFSGAPSTRGPESTDNASAQSRRDATDSGRIMQMISGDAGLVADSVSSLHVLFVSGIIYLLYLSSLTIPDRQPPSK